MYFRNVKITYFLSGRIDRLEKQHSAATIDIKGKTLYKRVLAEYLSIYLQLR